MERTLRSIIALALLCAGIALFAFTEGGDASGASASPIVEAVRYEQLQDGRAKEVRALIDTRLADPDEVMEALAPNGEPPSEVTAAFAASRKWRSSAIPVPVYYNPVYEPSGVSGAASLEWAIGLWNGVSNQGFRFSAAGSTTIQTPGCDLNNGDGVNTVRFSYVLDYGVLGETCSLLTGPVGGYTGVDEFDMHLDAATDWSRATPTPKWEYDLDSVMLHELGHALGLGHSNNGTVMQVAIDDGEQFRSLTADDIAGIRAIYGTPPTATSTPSNTPTRTPTQSPAGTPVGGYRLVAGMLARDQAPSTPPPAPPTNTPPTATPTPTLTPTPTPTQPPAAGISTRNSSWYTSSTGSIWVVGEVVNGLNEPVEFVEITANLYSASGTLLATDFGFSDLWTIPAGGDSSFSVLVLDPPPGVASVTVQVTDYDTDPFLPPATGLSANVTNVYRSIIDSVHVVGTVTNSSPYTYDFVQVFVAFYDSEGRVVRTDFTFTEPTTLAPGQTGTFDVFTFDAPPGMENAPRRIWIDGNR